MYKNFLCGSLALFALTGSALAVSKCYYCDGNTDKCDDPVDTSKLDTCTSVTPVSAASAGEGFACATVVLSDSRGKSTFRSCAYEKVDGKRTCSYLMEQYPYYNVQVSCTSCDTDLCNSASSVAISLLSFVGLFVLFALK